MKKSVRRILLLLLVTVIVSSVAYAVGDAEDVLSTERVYETKSDLPQVYITITDPNYDASDLTKSLGYVSCSIEIYDPSGEYDTMVKEGTIKVRGNTTANGAKKPFNIKLSGKTNVLGMGKAKKWALLANMYDKTLMRNKLVFDFAHDLEMDYVSESRTVDVWLDGKYNGTYTLCEPVEIGSTRVDIDEDAGELLIEREKGRYESDATYLTTSRYGIRFVFDDPDDPTAEQIAMMKEKLTAVENAIATNDLTEMAKYLDVDSFVDMYIIEEYFKDVDADYSSAKYYFKDGILYAGPVWDFDLSAGNCSKTDYYAYNNLGTTGNSFEGLYADDAIWYKYLLKNADFYQLVRQRYAQLQSLIVNLYQDNELGTNRMDVFLTECADSIAANWAVWNVSSKDSSAERIPDSTYEKNVNYLRNWLSQRNEWLLDYYDLIHSIHVASSSLGDITVSGDSAVTRQTVTVTVVTNDVWSELSRLNIVCGNVSVCATMLEETVNDNGTTTSVFTFIMPDGDVKISAAFVQNEYSQNVRMVIDMIAKLGTVTEESGDAISAARTAYENLSSVEKKQVWNYRLLEDAEYAYTLILMDKASAIAQQAAQDAQAAAQYAAEAQNLADELAVTAGVEASAAQAGKSAAQDTAEAAQEAMQQAEKAATAAQNAGSAAQTADYQAAASAVTAAQAAEASAKNLCELALTKVEVVRMLLEATQHNQQTAEAALTSVRYEALLEIATMRAEVLKSSTPSQRYLRLLNEAEEAVRLAATTGKISSILDELNVAFAGYTGQCAADLFEDVQTDAWYYPYVESMVDAGWIKGMPNGTFDVNGEVTRAQMVTILYRMAGTPDVSGKTLSFQDVPEDAWYAAAVTWAYNEGIVKGTSKTTFEPDAATTREQMMTMLYQYCAEPAVSVASTMGFADESDISDYAHSAMFWGVKNGLLSGMGDSMLAPKETGTRAQICAIVMRFCEKIG